MFSHLIELLLGRDAVTYSPEEVRDLVALNDIQQNNYG